MLDLIRKKQKSSLIKLAFIIIILSFIIGYAMLTAPGDRGGTAAPTDVAARVNGTEISYQEYQGAYRNLYQLYQDIYQDQFSPALEKQLNLPKQALEQLVNQTLLLQEARRRGIEVSRKELVQAIAEVSAFQENGTFSKNRYIQVLNYQRMTPDEFEAMQRTQLMVDKLREQLKEKAAVTPEEIEEEYRRLNEKVDLAFVRLNAGLYEPRVKVDDAKLTAYFEDNREEFRQPEAVALNYIVFKPGDYRDDVVFEEGDLEKYYRRHLDRFEIPEQVKARHVLIKVPQEADAAIREKRRKLAEEVLDKAKAGGDFAELARQYSDDKGTATQGGELGYFTRGSMVKPFEEAAFRLQPGEISDIVETNFGFHVIKVEGYIEAGIKPLAEVVDEVKEGLREEKAARLAFEKAMDAYNINRKEGSVEAAAKANDLGLKQTGLFTEDEPVEGLGDFPEISATAFTLQEGELARPASTPQGVVLFSVRERRPSRLPELEEVRQQVISAYRAEQADALARRAAEEMLSAIEEGQDLAALAEKADLEVETTGLFARSYGDFVPRIGNAPQLAEDAFALTTEQPAAPEVYDLEGSYIVAAIEASETADMEKLDETKRSELRQSILTRKQNEAVQETVDALREQAEITYAPALKADLEGRQ